MWLCLLKVGVCGKDSLKGVEEIFKIFTLCNLIINLLIYSFTINLFLHQALLSTYYVLGTVHETNDIEMSTADMFFASGCLQTSKGYKN